MCSKISAIVLVFMCLITLQAPILQGVGMSGVPVASMLMGAIAKVLIGIFLVSELGIYACPIGTLVCYGLASLINGYFIECKASIQIPYFRYFFCTLICALPATALALVVFGLTQAYIGMNLACIVAILLCLVVYLALILFSGYFKIQDIVIALHLKGRI